MEYSKHLDPLRVREAIYSSDSFKKGFLSGEFFIECIKKRENGDDR